MKAKKIDPLRTEKAMREALREVRANRADLWVGCYPVGVHDMKDLKWYEVAAAKSSPGIPLAIFDLRDCIRLRAPLKGIKKAEKAMRKAVRGRR